MPRPRFPPQVVTAESTASLEELIKQRIIDGAFDDVEAKVPIEVKARKQREGVTITIQFELIQFNLIN